MTERFTVDSDGKYWDRINHEYVTIDGLFRLVEQLDKENGQLKKELAIYRKVASCGNCKYHNYDWYDDGDEFEVCDKGNDVTDGICEDWEEL